MGIRLTGHAARMVKTYTRMVRETWRLNSTWKTRRKWERLK